MKQTLKKIATQILGVANAFPTALTNKNQLSNLITKLQPKSVGIELIRLGPTGDGGYLLPNDLVGIEACFSPGVCAVSDFEKDCADFGMQVFLADKSVDGPATHHNNFVFTKKYVGATTSDDFMTIDNWVSSSLTKSGSDLLLQIDIEGYEYESFLCMSDSLLNRFRIIVVEFHDLDLLWSQPFFRLASPAFEKILQNHICVHIHPNNCCGSILKYNLEIPRVMEFTFIRKDRIKKLSLTNVFPHPLDGDNASKPSLPLPKCWYK